MTTRPRVGRRPVARAISVSAASIAAAGVALHLSRSGNPTIVVLATFAFAAWLFCLVALVAALRARSVGLTFLALALVAAGAALYVLRTDMASPSGPVTVVAVHPVAAVFDGARAVEEADRLRSYLGGLPGPAPVVVGGDFNATWDHVRFRELRDLGYADSVSAGEDGWIPTWPADRRFPPLIGIDHILARGAVSVGQTSTVRVDRTDHLGVQATVRLPPQRAR